MVRRLFVGLILGLFVGAAVAAALVAGLKMPEFLGYGGAVVSYVAAAATGVLTGLIAGKPIWASNAKIEAGLKALFGALLGAGLMFAMRQWGGAFEPDLTFIGAGHAPVGELPAASLPLLAALLGAFFELDNTGAEAEAEAKGKPGAERKRVGASSSSSSSNGSSRARVLEAGEGDGEEAEVVSRRAKR
jgi:hypothetical protein